MRNESQTCTILIANTDLSMSRAIYNGIMEYDSEYAVEIVGFGTEAKEKLAKQHYPLVITGCFLPDMTGYSLARSIKSNNPETKTLLIAPNKDQCFGDLADLPEIDHLIQNPISPDQIQHLVGQTFGRAKATEAATA